jgi:hypothetical protein
MDAGAVEQLGRGRGAQGRTRANRLSMHRRVLSGSHA